MCSPNLPFPLFIAGCLVCVLTCSPTSFSALYPLAFWCFTNTVTIIIHICIFLYPIRFLIVNTDQHKCLSSCRLPIQEGSAADRRPLTHTRRRQVLNSFYRNTVGTLFPACHSPQRKGESRAVYWTSCEKEGPVFFGFSKESLPFKLLCE